MITISEHRTLSGSHSHMMLFTESRLVGGLTVTVTFPYKELVILFSIYVAKDINYNNTVFCPTSPPVNSRSC